MTHDSAVSNLDLATAIQNLHTDLATWLGTDASPEVLDRFTAAQHPEFTMVATDGSVTTRESLFLGLRQARNAVPGLRIDIDEVTELHRANNTIIVRFRETHHAPAATTARRTTAVLLTEPTGYRWHSLHETPIA